MTPVREKGEKRKLARVPTSMEFGYSVTILDYKNLRKVESRGVAVDRSKAGMGFVTEYPLEPGHVVRINSPEISSQPFMVKWVRSISGNYRVGGIFL